MAQTTRRQFAGITVVWTALLFLAVPFVLAQDERPVRDLRFFLGRLRTVDHLPELEASHTAMSSTWDRSGGNADGTDFKNVVKPSADGPGRNILLDTPGPGCIHRIFVGVLTEQQAGTRIQIFLDHRPRPSFDLPILEFFNDSTGPFPYPLVFHKSYPGTLFPIPFEKHCLVQLVNERTTARAARSILTAGGVNSTARPYRASSRFVLAIRRSTPSTSTMRFSSSGTFG